MPLSIDHTTAFHIVQALRYAVTAVIWWRRGNTRQALRCGLLALVHLAFAVCHLLAT